MNLYHKIDVTTGLFIEDVLLNSIPVLTETVQETQQTIDSEGNIINKIVDVEKPILDTEGKTIPNPQYIDVPCPEGFYHPKWDGSQWGEGGSAPEQVPQSPTEKDRIQALEDAMLTIMMGGM